MPRDKLKSDGCDIIDGLDSLTPHTHVQFLQTCTGWLHCKACDGNLHMSYIIEIMGVWLTLTVQVFHVYLWAPSAWAASGFSMRGVTGAA